MFNIAEPPPWAIQFFGGSNQFIWEKVVSRTLPEGWAEDILPWLHILELGGDAAALLPHCDPTGRVTWYGIATTPRAALNLSEDLAGFVGQTYGAFDGRPYIPDPADAPAPALALAAAFPGPLFRVAPEDPGDIPKIRRCLLLYRQLIERRPSQARLVSRSIGALRTRFDTALLAGNEAEALRLYDEILASGRLSWDNRLYLRVRLRAGLGQWPQIALDAQLMRDAGNLALPARVRAEIIEALYRSYAEPLEVKGDAAAALAAFDTAGVQRLAPLFSTRQGIDQPRVAKAFLLHALLLPSPDRTELDELVALLPHGTPQDAAFSWALRKLVDQRVGTIPKVEPVAVVDADTAFDDFAYDRAMALYAALPTSRKTIGRMLQCAKMIGRPESANLALAALDAWSGGEAELPDTLRTVVLDLRSLVAVPSVVVVKDNAQPASAPVELPDDWLSWSRWVDAGAPANDARRRLEDRWAAWSPEPFRIATQAEELARHLGNAGVSAGEVVQAAYPHLFETFVSAPETPIAAWKPLYATLLSILAMSGSRSADDLELARVLASVLLDVGLEPGEYDNLIRDLKDILGKEASLATLDWALDVAEVLLLNRAPLPEARLGLIVAVLEIARSRAHRLTPRHAEALRMLCEDIEIDVPSYLSTASEQPDETGKVAELAGRSIAIYTLAEAAGQRAAKMLGQLVPDIKVSLNNDTVCTERLASLAQKSDLFVFAWRSSKHAAYYCIKNHRPKDLPIVMPRGKGTASILHALFGN